MNNLRPLTEDDLGQCRTLVGNDRVKWTGKVKFIIPPPGTGTIKQAIVQTTDENSSSLILAVVHEPQVVL